MSAPPPSTPPVLLPMAAYQGTLAALRCLGAAKIPVTVAEGGCLVPAVWSRYVSRRVRCPDPEDPARFVPWLLEFGEKWPGHVLYPTSDDVAFLYARHRDELTRHFILRHPSIEATYQVLNKTRLRTAAEAVGLSMPRTWVPRGESDFVEIEAQAQFPVVVKPQTQVLLHPHSKGVPVYRASDLRRSYAEFVAGTSYDPSLIALDPEVVRPTVQEYTPEASEHVYGISGFVDESGEFFAARASRKVLQQPRQLGVGLCFEEAELQPALLDKIIALCGRVRYHGVFEAEFIESRGAMRLIDFNPRFYGQMAFDIARGLPQPLLAYDAALGRRDSMRRRIEAARASPDLQDRVYCRGMELKLLLRSRWLFGSISREESDRWWAWLSRNRTRAVDAIFDPGDRMPGWIEALHHFAAYARHPRSFVRQVIRS